MSTESVTSNDAKVVRISILTGIKPKMVASFINGFGVDNDRYQKVFNWVQQKALSHKQFKILVRNMKISSIDQFEFKGGRIFMDRKDAIGSFPDDYMIGG